MGIIHVVGLGPGAETLLTRQTWNCLSSGMPLYLRTRIHPSVAALDEQGLTYQTFDALYDTMPSFEAVYGTIVASLQEAAQAGDIVYAVPGSPLVAERTVQLLKEQVPKEQLRIYPAMSFLEVLYTSVGLDPVEGLYVTDGMTLETLTEIPPAHVIITQLYSPMLASEVKLNLMDHYEDTALVTVVHHLSLPEERVETVPLYELDRLPYIDHLTSLVVPKDAARLDLSFLEEETADEDFVGEGVKDAEKGPETAPVEDLDTAAYVEALTQDKSLYTDTSIAGLQFVMEHLLGPDGCPWDRKQTHRSLRRYLIEECYETLQAIDAGDDKALCEELGDVLFQVVFHAQIAAQEGRFSMRDILYGVTRKMILRHPHVFGGAHFANAEAVSQNWDALKAKEKGEAPKTVMGNIPPELPTLLKAQKIQEKAAKVGFTWPTVDGIWDKVAEEMDEFKEALATGTPEMQEKEAGDVLFSLINLFEWFKISGENALRATNDKFLRRFSYVEQAVKREGKTWSDFTIDELDAFWEEAKVREKRSAN